jgi:hypothetical protein
VKPNQQSLHETQCGSVGPESEQWSDADRLAHRDHSHSAESRLLEDDEQLGELGRNADPFPTVAGSLERDRRPVPDAGGDDHVQTQERKALQPGALTVEDDNDRQDGRQDHGSQQKRG